jgi:ketosteroid isomerase-like protein
MTASETVAIVLQAFRAVEERDDERLLGLYHPERELHWTPSLPFGGTSRAGVKDRAGPRWSQVWEPFQPTEAERRMDPRVVAATEKEVVVLWHQRAVSPGGKRFDDEVLGLYEVRDQKLARAQMFYFDAIAVQRFLATAEAEAGHLAAEPADTA